MSDYGMKISDENIDVNSAEPNQLVYSSKYSNFKIHSIVNKNVSIASGYHIVNDSVANPMPYSPMFLAFIESSNQPGWWHEAKGWSAVYTTTIENNIHASVNYNPTTNNFDIKIITYAYDWPGGSYNIKIVVFVDNVINNLLGIDSIGNYGIKASKDDKSAINSVDSDMSMDSKYRNLTVFDSSVATTSNTTPYSSDDGVVTIDHNLGYVPIVFCYHQPPGESYYQKMPSYYTYGPGAQEAIIAFCKVNSTQLYIHDQGYYTGSGMHYSYLIFNEQLA